MKLVWEWPQITWLCLNALSLFIGLANDGEPKTGNHSLAVCMLAVIISGVLMYYGGFLTEVRP